AQQRGRIQIRVFQTEKAGRSFHPKAYLLYGDTSGRASATYVGSSNLSRTGLFDGVEWNMRLDSTEAARLTRENFEALFFHEATCDVTHAWVDAYEQRRPSVIPGNARPDVAVQEDEPVPVPAANSVQADALE